MNAATTSVEARPGAARRSFAEIAEAELDAVYRYLVYLVGDRSLAEDLAAETFEKAFRAWRRFDAGRARPRTWLCSIARNVALDWLRAEERRRRREEIYVRRGADPSEAPLLDGGLSGPLERALRELSRA